MAMMISKFHKIIQSKIVWTAFAILISVAFVGVYTGSRGNNQKARMQQENELAGQLYGKGITRREFGLAKHHIIVTYSIMTGRQLKMNDKSAAFIESSAWKRLATLDKAEQMGMSVTPEQVVEMIKSQPLFMNRQTGQFDRSAYNAFVAHFLPSVRMTAKNFEFMMHENALIEKVIKSATQGALVTEDEIKERFHLRNDLTTVEYALLSKSLTQAPETTEADAQRYYTQNPSEFFMPETVVVKYIQYPISDFSDAIEISDEQVAQFYENNKQHYLKPVDEKAAEITPEYQPLEEVKESIVEGLTSELARRSAFETADILVAQLANESITFEAAAASAGRSIQKTSPFAISDTVKNIDPTATSFTQAAFSLQSDKAHYYSDPVRGADVIYVMALETKNAAFLLEFDIVKNKALKAASTRAQNQAYLTQVEEVFETTRAALKTGERFSDLIANQGAELQQVGPFNADSKDESEFAYAIMGASFMFDAGTLVDLIPAGDEFLIAYVSAKKPADEVTTLPAIRNELVENIHNEKASRMATAWTDALLKEAEFKDLTNHDS